LQDSQPVGFEPVPDDAASLELVDRDCGVVDLLVAGRKASERTLMSASPAPPHRDPIAVRDQIFEHELDVREAGAERFDR
jgi:hypothetical protein